ncbi:condensation domain-containing protein [Kitasatospora sp. NPDC051853]|uniref:condensation domain-containing protein n=1 Tax=Kitasatospora sp. NPDC051853 TaxID=3364058 RepID=UPI00378D37DD
MTDTAPTNDTDLSARQAELLRRARSGGGRSALRPGPAGPAPLSHAQHRMWLMDRLGQGGALYNVPVAARLRGPLDTEALTAALTALTERHAILRTRYVRPSGDGGTAPYQEVLPTAPVPVEIRPAEASAALLRAEASRPFDLENGPVLRALVLRHGPEDHTLLLTVHHIAVDGSSLPVLTTDLAALYAAARTGTPADLPELPLQYADLARWERARDPEFTAAAEARAAELAGARPLPLLRTVPGGPRARTAALHDAPLSPRTLDGLRRLAAAHGATLYTVVLAAALATLHRATGEHDLTVGLASGHRARPELRRLVGLGVNTLAVRADLGGDPEFTEALARVRTALLDAQQHHDLPFDLVVERLGAEARGEDGGALLNVTCDLVQPVAPLELPGLTAEALQVDLGLAKFGLGLLVEDGPEPRCLVQHDTDALDRATGERLLTAFAAVLDAVAADPADRLSALPGSPLTTPAAAPTAPEHPAVALLLADPWVTDAAVVTAEGHPTLAYVTLRGPFGPSANELMTTLRRRRRLTPEQRPSAITVLDTMPRSADGTLDPTRLPGARVPVTTPNPFRGPLDAVLATFGELLGSRPEPDADFFVLGGHSLVAVQLAERLRTRTGLPLTGLDVLEQRTPRALSALLADRDWERRAASARTTTASPRPATPRTGTVLLTGGTGGVGAAVLRELLAQGRPVRALARPESAHLVALDGVEVTEGDLTDPDSLRRAVEGVDAVIHAACTFTDHETDIAAMRALLDGWTGRSFVFVSSTDAYGRPATAEVPEGAPPTEPVTPYGRAKLACEQLLLDHTSTGPRTGTVVRPPIVWGPQRRLRDQLRWGSTGDLYQAALAGRPLVLPAPGAGGHPWHGASWVHSAALARTVVACTSGTTTGRIVNAATGHVSWADFGTELVRLLGSTSEVVLTADPDPELIRPWHYTAEALADTLRPAPGEDWRTVLAAMTG